jgi:hypothetical protein
MKLNWPLKLNPTSIRWILNFDTVWSSIFSFTLWPLYLQEMIPWNSLHGKLGVRFDTLKKINIPLLRPGMEAVFPSVKAVAGFLWRVCCYIYVMFSSFQHDNRMVSGDSGNACYHSVQNLLSSRLLSKNIKIRIYRTIILPVVLDGCETWCLTLREEHRLRVFENRVLRKIFGLREIKWQEIGGNCITRSFITCTPRQT